MMKLFYSNELRTLEKYAFIQNYTPAYTEVISLVTTRTFVLSIITRRRIKFEGLTTLWSFLCRAILECVHSIHPFDVSSCTHACKRVIKVRYISRRVLSRLPFRFTLVDTSVRAKRKKKKKERKNRDCAGIRARKGSRTNGYGILIGNYLWHTQKGKRKTEAKREAEPSKTPEIRAR